MSTDIVTAGPNNFASDWADGINPLGGQSHHHLEYSVNINNSNSIIEVAGRPLKVFVLGDSWGSPSSTQSGVQRGIITELVERIGYSGYAGSQTNFDVSRGGDLPSTDGQVDLTGTVDTLYGTDEWFGKHYKLNAVSDSIRFYRSGSIYAPCTKYGVYWIATPTGGDIDFGIARPGPAFSSVATLDGYSATPVLRYQSFSGDYEKLQFYTTVISGTANYVVGVDCIDESQNGVVIHQCWKAGANITQVTPSKDRVAEFVTAYDPDLILFCFGDIGQSTEANYRTAMEDAIKPIFDAGVNANVVLLGMPYADDPTLLPDPRTENGVMREYAAAYNWTYFDANRDSGNIANTIEREWQGTSDEVMLRPLGQRAYARNFLSRIGVPNIDTRIGDFAALTQWGSMDAAVTGVPTVLTGYDNTKTFTRGSGFVVDEVTGTITVSRTGKYKITAHVGDNVNASGGDHVFQVNANGVSTGFMWNAYITGARGIGSAVGILDLAQSDELTLVVTAGGGTVFGSVQFSAEYLGE